MEAAKWKEAEAAGVDVVEEEDEEDEEGDGVDPGEEDSSAETAVILIFMP